MIAALQAVRVQKPRELIVAVPVASPQRLEEVQCWCDDIVCLLTPEMFCSVGQFYADFSEVEDKEVEELLRKFTVAPRPEATVECRSS